MWIGTGVKYETSVKNGTSVSDDLDLARWKE